MKQSIIILLVGISTLCVASPARFFNRPNRRTLGTVATVDCSNPEAVEFVARTHANFRCVFPNERHQAAPLTNEVVSTRVFHSPNFPQGLHSRSQIKEDPSANGCPDGQVYSPSIDRCLPATKPLKTAPLESDSLVIEEKPLEIKASSTVQTAKDCTSDEVFNSELSICLPYKRPSNTRPPPSRNLIRENAGPLEIQAFSSGSQSAEDCKAGEMFVAEISACVSMKPGQTPIQSASLVRSQNSFPKANSVQDCNENEVFVPEIGICQPANAPKVKRPLVSDSLVKEIIDPTPKEETLNCPPGQIEVAELNICMPFNTPNAKPGPPPSSSLVKEPEKLELVAFSSSVDSDGCENGQHYLSELGICI